MILSICLKNVSRGYGSALKLQTNVQNLRLFEQGGCLAYNSFQMRIDFESRHPQDVCPYHTQASMGSVYAFKLRAVVQLHDVAVKCLKKRKVHFDANSPANILQKVRDELKIIFVQKIMSYRTRLLERVPYVVYKRNHRK